MITIMWQNNEGKWLELPFSDLAEQSRDHATSLFNRKIPVIIKQGSEYIVNNMLLLKQYQHNKKKVKLLSDVKPNSGMLKNVGFIYD